MHGNKHAAYFHQYQTMEIRDGLVSIATMSGCGELQLRGSHHRLIRFKSSWFHPRRLKRMKRIDG
jgi:hypothetical protein